MSVFIHLLHRCDIVRREVVKLVHNKQNLHSTVICLEMHKCFMGLNCLFLGVHTEVINKYAASEEVEVMRF